MSSSNDNNNSGLNVCGMDFDNLCVHPDLMIEDGDAAADLENPMAYRHTQSGLEAFKEDMMHSMLEEQERAKGLYARATPKKKSWLGSLGRKSSDGEIAEEYRPDDVEEGNVRAAPVSAAAVPSAAVVAVAAAATANSSNKTTDRDTTKDDATVVTHSEESLEDSRVKAMVYMISGCEDAQTSADVSNVSSFSLPDPNGRSGGACTSALLKGTYM